MKGDRKKTLDRILALVMALSLVFGVILPRQGMVADAAQQVGQDEKQQDAKADRQDEKQQDTKADKQEEAEIEKADAVIAVQNADGENVKDAKVQIWKDGESNKKDIGYSSEKDGYAALALEKGSRYQVEISRTGYTSSKSSFTAGEAVDPVVLQYGKVQIAIDKAKLEVGDTAKGSVVNAISGKKYEWESANPKVAEVKADGSVSAKAEGETTITALIKGKGDTRSENVKISVSKRKTHLTVKAPAIAKVGKPISIEVKLEGVKEGSGSKIEVEINGNKLGTVEGNAGTLNYTFDSEGTYEIKAKYNGNDQYGNAETSASVAVTKNDQASLDIKETELLYGETKQIAVNGVGTLSAEIVSEGGNLTAEVKAGKDELIVTGKRAGKVTVKVARDGGKEYHPISRTVEFNIQPRKLIIRAAAADKAYDGKTDAKVSLAAADPIAAEELLEKDREYLDKIKSLVTIKDAKFNSADAGKWEVTFTPEWMKPVAGDKVGEDLVNNYVLVGDKLGAEIKKRELIIVAGALTARDKVYSGHSDKDKTVTFEGAAGSVAMKDGSDDVTDAVKSEINTFTVEGEAVMKDENAGENKEIDKISSAAIQEKHDNYQLVDWEKYTGLTVKVEPAVIPLSVGDARVEYQKVDGTLDCLGDVKVTADTSKMADGDSIDKYELPKVAMTGTFAVKFKEGISIKVNPGYQDALCLEGMQQKEDKITVAQDSNYQWELRKLGEVEVVQDPTVYSLDNVKAEGNCVIRAKKVWVKDGTDLLLKPDDQVVPRVYDSLWTWDKENKCRGENLSTVGMKENFAEGSSLDVCFSNSEGGDCSQPFLINITTDSTPPAVNCNVNEKVYKNQDFTSAITFGIFSNKTVEMKVEAEDTQSGIGSVETAVYGVEDKEKIDALAGIDQKGIAEMDLQWTAYSSQGPAITGETTKVSWERAVTVPAEKYAVVFVKVSDKAGNALIYGSNGMIVECTVPERPTVTFSSENYHNGIYTGDVSATINTSEILEQGNSVASGLASVKYTLYRDGKTVSEKYTNQELYQDAYAGKMDGTLGTLQNTKSMTFEDEITIPAEVFNSNCVTLVVTAKDRAGNEISNISLTGDRDTDLALLRENAIKIDITKPEVSVSYDNNAAENDKYFKALRKATITVKERNLKKENLKIQIQREKENGFSEYTVDALNAQDGITAKWISDSQAQTDSDFYTDERVSLVEITFEKDDHYKIDAAFADQGGLAPVHGVVFSDKDRAPKDFVIDTIPPQITVAYTTDGKSAPIGQDKNNRSYFNRTVTASIRIEEHNFALGNAPVDAQVSLHTTKVPSDQKVADYDTYLKKSAAWSSITDERSALLEFTTDANYTFGFEYTDLAGNRAVYRPSYFTVDRTDPTGTIKVGEMGTWGRFISKISFGLFEKVSQKISLTGEDFTSPVASISYTTSNKKLTRKQVEEIDKWKKGTSLRKTPNQQFIVYSRVEDQAGNVAYFSSEGIILDNKKPGYKNGGPSITITAAKPAHGIYAGDVPFTVRVEDPTAGDTYSGLKSVAYEILNGSAVTQSGNFDSQLKPASKRVKSLKKDLTVNARKNNSNHVKIRVTAVDNAGNQSVKTEELKIDVTDPTITVTYNTSAAQNGTYYKDGRVATVSVKERNFDPENVKFTITNTDGTRPSISGWSSSSNAGESDEATHTCTVSFDSDGDYTFTAECTDLAGNRGSYGKTDNFTVDKTIPRISVSYDNNNVSGERYFKEQRTATITVTEHNFNAGDVKAAITASLNGQGITAPVISGFTNNGDAHTATVSYMDSGDYTFDISCVDMAGNPAETVPQDSFTIDLDKPYITISGVEKANKDAVRPLIEVKDNNYDGTKVSITLKGTKHPEKELTGSRSQIELGESIRIADFAHKEEVDDIYTLTVKAEDKAGNTQEESYTFSVNRFGSVYTMDEDTEELIEGFYTNNPRELVITETNTDELQFQKITCSKDGELFTMKAGQHYDVTEAGGEGSWRVYTYQIHSENFAKDGRYIVNIYSEDKARNSSSNQSKNKTIEFVVDKTKPTIEIAGIENGARYTEDSRQINIDAEDNIYLKSLTIEVLEDGAGSPKVYQFTEEQLKENYGVVTQAVLSANKWQTVTVRAADAAGNEIVKDGIRILVTSNMLIQYYMNKPLFFGSILLVLALIGLSIYLGVRRKRALAGRR